LLLALKASCNKQPLKGTFGAVAILQTSSTAPYSMFQLMRYLAAFGVTTLHIVRL
jgi:hypothetical protein